MLTEGDFLRSQCSCPCLILIARRNHLPPFLLFTCSGNIDLRALKATADSCSFEDSSGEISASAVFGERVLRRVVDFAEQDGYWLRVVRWKPHVCMLMARRVRGGRFRNAGVTRTKFEWIVRGGRESSRYTRASKRTSDLFIEATDELRTGAFRSDTDLNFNARESGCTFEKKNDIFVVKNFFKMVYREVMIFY